MLLVLLFGLALLYRYGPDRRVARWQWVSVGSVFAAVTWIVASYLFSWYLASFANYNATYGSLGAVVGLMMWLWISTIVVLLGAELNAEIEHQTARDSTVGGEEKPLGARGAVMADTVGRSRHKIAARPCAAGRYDINLAASLIVGGPKTGEPHAGEPRAQARSDPRRRHRRL